MKNNLSDFLPGSKGALDFAKMGLGLYLLGLFIMFVYFIQLNVLSVDLIKPHAIIVGIYVWFLFDTLPKILLFILNKFKLGAVYYNFMFVVCLLAIYTSIIVILGNFNIQSFFLGLLITLNSAIYFSTSNPVKSKMAPSSSALKSYLFIVVFGVLFSTSVFPNIPQYFGGGHPLTVKVFPEDREVFKSQFSNRDYDCDGMIEADLLYESDDAYYFIQNIGLENSDIIFNYKVKKIKKDLIKKIEFTKPIWITFKK